MKNKLIIFLLSIKVRQYDYDRFDASEIEKSEEINYEFHELVDYINPGFANVFTADRIKNNNVKIFSNFEDWKLELLKKKEKYNDKLIVYNAVELTNLKSFKVNYFLKKNNIKTISASNLDHPTYTSGNYTYKLKWLFRNFFFNNKKIRLFIKNFFFTSLGKIFKIQPNFYLKCGTIQNKYENKNSIIVLNGHSRDYNMYLKSKQEYFNRHEKYGLYLESASPVYNLGDALITGDEKNVRGTPEKWLLSLNNFFSFMEKTLNLKILIVPHPKIKHEQKYSRLYNGREILNLKLSVVSKNCELIVSRDSTGCSYGAIYNKPIIFMYNNELLNLNNNFINNQKNFANELGLSPVNIDKQFTSGEILKLIKFNEKHYASYVSKYLTSRSDKKLNYQVLADAFDVKISF